MSQKKYSAFAGALCLIFVCAASPPLFVNPDYTLFHIDFREALPGAKVIPASGLRPTFFVLESAEVEPKEGTLVCQGKFPGFIPVSTAAIQAVSQSGQISIRISFRVKVENLIPNTHGFLCSWGGYNWGPRLSVMAANPTDGTFDLFFGVPGFQKPTLLRRDHLVSGRWYITEAQLDKPRARARLLIDSVMVSEIEGAEHVNFRDLTYMRFLVGANQTGPMMDKNAQNLFFNGEIKDILVSSTIGESP